MAKTYQLANNENCLDEIKYFCEEWVGSGKAGADIARDLGHEERARGFEARNRALRGVLAIMERHAVPRGGNRC